MKIFEVINLDNFNAEEYDVLEDLIFFMNNDPGFYRHEYYPTIMKFRDCQKSGVNFESKNFKPIIEKAYKEYQSRFPVKGLKEKMTLEMLEELCAKLYESELENIKAGQYEIKK